MNNLLRFFLFLISFPILITGCIEDSFSTSPSDQPVFSTDTLSLGTLFTEEPSATSMFVVRNPHSKGMNITAVSVSGTNAEAFRVNVDGIAGHSFSNVEIRANDSIFVMVEATLPELAGAETGKFTAYLNFLTNGVTSSVVLEAEGQNVTRLRAEKIEADMRFTAIRPYQIFDSLVVAEGATLTVDAGVQLLFHDKASMIVHGTIICEGNAEAPIEFKGDRTGNVVGDVPFDLMSNQWEGVFFTATSEGNQLTNTIIKNTRGGVVINEGGLTLINCRLRNSGGTVLHATDATVKAVGCEFAEASDGLVDLCGGNYVFNHCTFANYYLFSVLSGPAIDFNLSAPDAGELHLDVSNSIIYGNGSDLSDGNLEGYDISFRNCLFKSEGTDDGNFINCIWGQDPLYYTVRAEYYFDYRLQPESPALGAGNPALTLPEAMTDWYGNLRGDTPDIGAYVFQVVEQE